MSSFFTHNILIKFVKAYIFIMRPLHNSCSLKEAMTVSERRYLKGNSTELFSDENIWCLFP
jgi:hypothetical protein